jgi:membrane protein
MAAPARHHVAREFVRQLWESIGRNQPFDLAAQLAYFALMALFPFLMFLLTIVGYLPLHGVDKQILRAAYDVMPHDTAALLQATLEEIVGRQRGWLLVVTLLFGTWTASGGASGAITALNRAYDVAETRPAWRVKVRALLVTVGALLAGLVATTALLIGPSVVHAIWAFFGLGGAFDRVWSLLRWPVAFFTMTLMLACIYYFLPNVKQKWRFITPGSVVAVLAWLAASWGFRIYVSHFNSYARTYGALGTVVVLLVWLYLSGLMLILGGEINAILDRVHKGIVHTEQHEGPARVHDPRPVVGDDERRTRNDKRPPRRPVRPAETR